MNSMSMIPRGIITISNRTTPELIGKTVAKNCKRDKCPLYGRFTQTCDHLLLTKIRKPVDENGNCILSKRATPVDYMQHKYALTIADRRYRDYDTESFCKCYNASMNDVDTAKAMGVPVWKAKYIRTRYGLPAARDKRNRIVPHDPVTPEALERRYWQMQKERRKK
jgi:hypothetical protein